MNHLARFADMTAIGQGGMGTVYEAITISSGKQVVLKKLSKKMSRRRIDMEVQTGTILRGVEGIPYFYEQFEADGFTWLVSELIEGKDLLHWMEDNNSDAIDEVKAKDILRQLVTIIMACHSSGIAHKDIKLENIMMGNNGKIHLIDFGLAYHFEDEFEDGMCNDRCGSKEYIAPEVFWTICPTFSATAADVWALGITFYCMIFGSFPYSYDHKTVSYIESTGLFPEVPFPKRSFVSVDAQNLILDMLEVSTDSRIPMKLILSHSWMAKKKR